MPEKKPEALKPLRERKPRPAREEGEARDFAPMVPAETFAPTEPPVIHPEDTPAGRAQKFLMDVTDRMGVKVDVYVDDSKADNLSIHMIATRWAFSSPPRRERSTRSSISPAFR